MAREARLPYSEGVTVFKGILIGLGTVFLVLGAIGAVVPLLPTTPFLLAAGACFARSSDRMHAYLYNHRIFGEYLRNYEKTGDDDSSQGSDVDGDVVGDWTVHVSFR